MNALRLQLVASAMTMEFIAGALGSQEPAVQTAPELSVGRKFSLAAGISGYRGGNADRAIPNLKFGAKNAESVHYALQSQGFDGTLVVNEDVTRRRLIAELLDLTNSLQPQDELALYVSGHLVRGQYGNLYWWTYDSAPSWLEIDGIRLEHLLEYLAHIPAERKLALLDFTFLGGVEVREAEPGAASARLVLLSEARLVPALFSRALEGFPNLTVVAPMPKDHRLESDAWGHGFFAHSLLQAFSTRDADADEDGGLSVAELSEFLASAWDRQAEESGRRLGELAVSSGANESALGWKLIDSLPLGGEAVLADRDFYLKKLRDWESRDLIDFETRIECVRVLQSWVKSLESGEALSGSDERLFDEVREHLDSDAPEDILGPNLVFTIEKLQGRR